MNPDEARILVVDDMPQLRQIILRWLLIAGYAHAEVVGTAWEAWAACERGVDLVVLDVGLLRSDRFTDGCAAGLAMAAHWPTLRLLFTSGRSIETLPATCPRGLPFMQKPVAMQEFLARVREVLLHPPWRPGEEDR